MRISPKECLLNWLRTLWLKTNTKQKQNVIDYLSYLNRDKLLYDNLYNDHCLNWILKETQKRVQTFKFLADNFEKGNGV